MADQLSLPQRMLVFDRLAKTLADGHLGLLPCRAYGDAAIVFLFDELKNYVLWELEDLHRDGPSLADRPPAGEVPAWRELIRDAACEIGVDEGMLGDDADVDDWHLAIEDIRDTIAIDPIVYAAEPLFDAAPRDDYWAPLQYSPSMALVGSFYGDMFRTTSSIKDKLGEI